MNNINNIHAVHIDTLMTYNEIMKQHPISKHIAEHVITSRRRIKKILNGIDKRLLVIIGPCSIHDLDASLEYAYRLLDMRKKYWSRLEIIMRTYFEKPRTIIGWKGLISDPDLNGSYRINHGIELARKLLLQLNELGIPTATEFLDIATVHLTADLISYGVIGARTTESQIHREMASALSCPIGFKNGTNGNISIAIDAIRAARAQHILLLPDTNGKIAIYQSHGNKHSYIIMRGGKRPNYYANNIAIVCNMLHKFNLPEYLIIDLSHGNCQKQHRRQLIVCEDICQQISNGSTAIAGIIVESFLKEGKQTFISGQSIIYGQSITDPCLGWEDSEIILEKLALAVEKRFYNI